jgi:hypothetical protein
MGGGGEAILDEHAAEHASVGSVALEEDEAACVLTCWDEGQLAWRLLQVRGGVRRFANTLTIGALCRAVFECADAHFMHTRLAPNGGDAPATLQEYLDFAWRLAERCVVPREPLPTEGSAQEPAALHAALPPPATLRLKHAWPAYDAHFVGTIRKHALLRAGIREHQEGNCSLEAAAKAFRTMCRLVLAFGKGQRRGRKLSYSQQAAALRAMPGNNFADLVFRQTVVGRAAKGTAAQVLLHASRSEAEQIICFLRWLDRDCDGYISEKDFSAASVVIADLDSAPALVRRWAAAAVKVDKPSLQGGARGVLDKLGPRKKLTPRQEHK